MPNIDSILQDGQHVPMPLLRAYLASREAQTPDDHGGLAEAIAAIGADVATLFINGSHVLSANLTIPTNVTLLFVSGSITTTGFTLTINGHIEAGPRAIFAGSGTVVIGRTMNTEGWAEWFPNADYGDKFSAMIAAVGDGPFTIKHTAWQQTFATAIDAQDTTCITITPGVSQNMVGTAGHTLLWTGGATSGSALKINGSRGFTWDGTSLMPNNAAYDDDIVDCGKSGAGARCYNASFKNCYIGGSDGIAGAASIFKFNETLNFDAGNISFDCAKRLTRSIGGSNNVVRFGVSGTVWADKHFSVAVFEGRGANWELGNVISESYPDTEVTSISNGTPAVVTLAAHGLVADWPVKFTTTGGVPNGLVVGTQYYVLSAGLTTGTFRVSASVGGAAINTTSAGSGTHKMCPALTKYVAIDTQCDSMQIGGQCIDGGSGGGILIDLSGGITKCTQLNNPLLSGGATTALVCSTTAGNTSVLTGMARIGGPTDGCDFGRATSVDLVLDALVNSVVWTGLEPTNIKVRGNFHGNSAYGVPILNNESVAITLPGDADDGMEMVLLKVAATGLLAQYALLGAASLAVEVFDSGGTVFDDTEDNATTINCYWKINCYRVQNKTGGTIRVAHSVM